MSVVEVDAELPFSRSSLVVVSMMSDFFLDELFRIPVAMFLKALG
jgi:hypothetical protein